MGRIVERLRAVGVRRGALFTLVTALVVVGLYVGLRESGVGLRS